MIYTTGTIAISGNTLTGTGTNFTAAGSLIRNGCTVIAMTSPVQVFQITTIGSATSLTVTPAANPAVPAGTRFAILLSDSLSVDGLAQDIAETFTMYQRYMSGFADVMNGTTDVTITINGVAVTVPGQKSLAKKGANSDITSLSGLTTALSISQGGTGAKNAADARTNLDLGDSATRNVGTEAGTVASGDDSRFKSIDGKDGGTVNGSITTTGNITSNYGGFAVKAYENNRVEINNRQSSSVTGAAMGWTVYRWYDDYVLTGIKRGNSTSVMSYMINFGAANLSFEFLAGGNATAPGTWTSNSDLRIKENVKRVSEPLEKMKMLRGCTWERKDGMGPGIGFIAQEVQSVFPQAVYDGGSRELTDGTVVENVLSVDVSGVSAALHHEAILSILERVEKLEAMVLPSD
ncbi:tail fiber domain-containing protein [Enterobacter hormaechei subsp. steigerwaltii]